MPLNGQQLMMQLDSLTSSLADSCGLLRQNRFSVVLDLTWGGWSSLQEVAEVRVS